jgi:GMC oxidoreductase/NAD(P)-binding Rossmann-like domain
MLLRTDQLNSRYNAFVIGSGPAGMTVALELAKANRRVLVFESGESAEPRDDFPTAVNYGHLPMGWWNRHSVRALGGTSAIWGGWCTTLTERDFDNPAVGVSWPIRRADLLPYYRRAAPVLDRDPSIVDVGRGLFPGFLYRPFSVREDSPTRFARKYEEVLDASSALHVALGCSVVGLDANEARSAVRTLTFFHHPSGQGKTLDISPSQSVVVAGGGIGNAQLLLQPRSDGAVPVGNESGLAGRFLMEHPHFVEAGECVLDQNLDDLPRPDGFGNPVHALVPDDELLLRLGLRSCSVDCQHPNPDHQIARYLSRELGRPCYHYHCTVRTEMLPAASNGVFLTGERDRAGFYVPAVRCVFDAEDFLNGETTLHTLSEALIQQRKGRIRIINSRIYHDVVGGGHLMGTTRMGTSRSASVTDADGRVHGYANLFIAGSSLFPTCGYANPTLTIVALALRLADRLKAA